MQRARLLTAAVGLLAERGYSGFSVAAICARAGVSRRTFYEVFENGDACLAGILADAEDRAERMAADLDLGGLGWRERVRMGSWAILCLADSDPALAKVCLVEAQRAGLLVQRERQRLIDRLIAVIDEGRLQGKTAPIAGELTAEAVCGAAISVLAARLANPIAGRNSSDLGGTGLRAMLGELAGMIVLPYCGSVVARREITRALPPVPQALAIEQEAAPGDDPLARLPMRLTYRTARVLQALAELAVDGAGASNRQVAERAGISDAGQASKLLSRLQQHDLIENTAEGNMPRGEANQWHLTATGRQLLRSITAQARTSKGSAT